MEQLHDRLTELAAAWRADGYACDAYPAIGEVLDWSVDPDTGVLRYLRPPQLRAIETYWYVRLMAGTPHVIDLYRSCFPKTRQFLTALGLDHGHIRDYMLDHRPEELLQRVRTDDEFVGAFNLQALRETLMLDYPSYILALAMGAGKTVLIGAIVATEFAMALEYPDGPFVQNALVFAPGKTIIESLRELADIPYAKLLPPRLHRRFATHLKLTFTRDGEKSIPVIPGSAFNLVVTNTEKIRIQKEAIRKADLNGLFSSQQEDQAKEEVANARLRAIASLPHLAVFSDEAHHTYGQSLNTGLKKVRRTVDYLAASTNLVCVVNSTGTPYFKRQPLRDVVVWYGLSEGIRDNILKDLSGNIQAYDFDGDPGPYVEHVIRDFFRDYDDVRLANGARAKLAIYFPQTDDVNELRARVDKAVLDAGESTDVVLVNTSDSALTKEADIRAFNRLNDPASPHRVILLVNKGTEGWNCPSLFACALARKLRSSNNFVLQAATRCLRQVPGNTRKARVYLSTENHGILDRQLRETYGESIQELGRQHQERARAKVVLRKLDIPPLVVTQVVRTVVPKAASRKPIQLAKPASADESLRKAIYTIAEQQATDSVLRQVGPDVDIRVVPDCVDAYAAATELATRYRLGVWAVYDELRRLYGNEDIPRTHVEALGEQLEQQVCAYNTHEETIDVALALVKPEGFSVEEMDGASVYTAEIAYPKDKEHLILHRASLAKDNPADFGFHYDPYGFDSNPENSFFEQALRELNLRRDEIEDIYFTGALTDPAQTDFFVEYKDTKAKWRRYTPDFVIRKKPPPGKPKGTGQVFIVEIKREHDRDHPIDGEDGSKALAVRRWENMDPKRFQYHMVFTAGSTVANNDLESLRTFIKG
ncbi:MAG: restriction endonuclease subunit R [Planctomycetota bacterium]